jgi:glycosyltransferase 2 family protein
MLLGLIFVGIRFWSYRDSVGYQLINPVLFFATLSCSIAYAASCLLLAFGWWLILHSQSRAERWLPWRIVWPIYGRTQIAKYIPGNIFHFTGRHVLSAREALLHVQLVAAATIEIIMMLIAAGSIGLLAARTLGDTMRRLSSNLPWIAGVGMIVVGSVVLSCLFLRFRTNNRLVRVPWRLLFGAQMSYLFFFLISAALFLFLLELGGQTWSVSHWPVIIGSYAVAWAIGFVVPGAPGGLGVREALLVAFLSGLLPEKSALAFRAVTTLGDILFFAGAATARINRF